MFVNVLQLDKINGKTNEWHISNKKLNFILSQFVNNILIPY
jgi:hypothetical protein